MEARVAVSQSAHAVESNDSPAWLAEFSDETEIDAVSDETIVRVLDDVEFDVAQAAVVLGMQEHELREHMQRLGIHERVRQTEGSS